MFGFKIIFLKGNSMLCTIKRSQLKIISFVESHKALSLVHYFSSSILMTFLSPQTLSILLFSLMTPTSSSLYKDPSHLEKVINIELNKISNWCKLNKLSLNIDKTNFMIFKNKHSNKPDLNYKIEIDDKNIEKVEITKFLGVLIDNNLSWKDRTMHISKIVSKYNGIIRKIRPYLNKDSLLTLYNTLVLPYLSYCTLVWGDKNNSFIESLSFYSSKETN